MSNSVPPWIAIQALREEAQKKGISMKELVESYLKAYMRNLRSNAKQKKRYANLGHLRSKKKADALDEVRAERRKSHPE